MTILKRYRLVLLSKRNFVNIGKDVFLPLNFTFNAETVVGDHTRFDGSIKIQGGAKVTIGKYCAMGSGVKIFSTNHKTNHANTQIALHAQYGFCDLTENKGDIVIGDNVWIGDDVIILPNVMIGCGSVVGAGSIVAKNVPPFTIVAGVPAREIRKRFNDSIIDALMKIKWWNWSENKIMQNKMFFNANLTEVSPDDLFSIIIE